MTVVNESSEIATAVRDLIAAMSEFLDASVFINNWDAFDESESKSPWVLIMQTGLVSSVDGAFSNDKNTWSVPIKIRIPFNDWNPDITTLATLRDAVHFELTKTINRSLGLADTGFFSVKDISDASPLDPVIGISFTDEAAILPDVLDLDMLMEVVTEQ